MLPRRPPASSRGSWAAQMNRAPSAMASSVISSRSLVRASRGISVQPSPTSPAISSAMDRRWAAASALRCSPVGSGGAMGASAIVGSCSRCTRRRQRFTTPESSSTSVVTARSLCGATDNSRDGSEVPALVSTDKFNAMALRKRKVDIAGEPQVHAEAGEERARRREDHRTGGDPRGRAVRGACARRGAGPVRPDACPAARGAGRRSWPRFSGRGGALHARISGAAEAVAELRERAGRDGR